MSLEVIKGNSDVNYDVVVIGAGFGGLYMLHQFRDKLGMRVKLYDKADGVGGTWYWNRYPGALSDTESVVYQYSFSKELWDEWEWSSRYIGAPEALKYLEFAADRLDLHRNIELNTEMHSAQYCEKENCWLIELSNGETVKAKYLITALGLLSATNIPVFKGQEKFQGEQYHTGKWPNEPVDFRGKRVGVIGTGSTGIQVITEVAPQAGHLTVFQRSPQYSVPIGNRPLSREQVAAFKKNYDEIWDQVRNSMVAFGFKESEIPAMSVSEEERDNIFERAWNNGGGFRFMFETFSDIATDRTANEEACKFIRKKISQIVKDPETARKLTPQEPYAKRPLCDSGYYATFNRENVDLVDVKQTPIVEFTENGVHTTDGFHELDAVIYATGFDAVDGNYTKLDIRGRRGERLKDKWKSGATSYLGITVAGFPNMFMVLGPNGPFTNLPPSIEAQVEWVAELVKHAENNLCSAVEPTQAAEEHWTTLSEEIANSTLFASADSWIFGANIPGKAHGVLFYFGGLQNYRSELQSIAEKGYEGIQFTAKVLTEDLSVEA